MKPISVTYKQDGSIDYDQLAADLLEQAGIKPREKEKSMFEFFFPGKPAQKAEPDLPAQKPGEVTPETRALIARVLTAISKVKKPSTGRDFYSR